MSHNVCKKEDYMKKKNTTILVFEYINNVKLGLSLTAFQSPYS